MRLHNGKKLLKLFGTLALAAIMFLSLSLTVSAADYVQLAPIPGTAPECATPPCGTNLSTYLTGMFKISIAAVGVLAFLMIVWGGFTYLSTDVIYGKEEGKTRIERALGGLILALASYIILNTINPQLVSLNLDFGPAADVKSALSAPADLVANQKRFDDTIKAGLERMEKTKMDATALEQQAKEYQQDLASLADEPENKGERDALEKLIAETSDQAQTRRTYDTASERITQAANQGLEGMTIPDGKTTVFGIVQMSTDQQINALKSAVAAINQNYQDAQVKLATAGKTEEIAKLFDERRAALQKVCARNNNNVAPNSVYETVPACNFYK